MRATFAASSMNTPLATHPGAAPAGDSTRYRVLYAISFSHFLNDMIQSLILAIYPMLKGEFSLSFGQIGLITLTYQLTASLLQPLVGLYTDRYPKPHSLAFGMGSTLCGLLLLCAIQPRLGRMSAVMAAVVVVGVAALAGMAFAALLTPLSATQSQPWWHAGFWAALATLVLLAWFDLAARARAPAVAEARLMALTARIRPHFLFNSLNAVLGVMRADPRRAEQALEELAELFRVLMQDNRELVPLSAEIALARQYLDLERLRLGDRLQVRWEIDTCPPDALVPPLMLQPLLENAVYHGIEPSPEGGTVSVSITQRGDELRIAIANPNAGQSQHANGNHIAVANIRERLALYYDLEARLEIEASEQLYEVRIILPCRMPNP